MENQQTTRKIISRRERPAKAPLGRDVIISTALNILESEGLEALSLRKVAAALDTGPASLYVYVANLQEMYALMIDRALGEVTIPDRGNWRDRLKALLLSYLNVFYIRPGLAQIAMTIIPYGENYLHVMESILELLKDGEIEDVTVAWGADLLTLYVTAIAAEKSNWHASGGGIERVKGTLLAVSAEKFPLLFACKEALLSGDNNARTAWAIDVIIEGIIGGPPPAETPAEPGWIEANGHVKQG